jgi:cell wall-associated NlpC family hydrolase
MIPRQPPPWVRQYIGLPFLTMGRDRAGCDCWGLVRLVLKEQFNIEIESHADEYDDALAGAVVAPLIEKHKPEWLEIAARAADMSDAQWIEAVADLGNLGDVALLRARGWPSHVGLIVARGRMLHIEAGIETMLERLDSPIWRQRVVGLYRHPRLVQPAAG